MATQIQHSELKVSVSGAVATVEICRPPHNYFDNRLIAQIGEAFEALDADPQCRAIVLAAEGKSFCAGANFSSPENQAVAVKGTKEKHLYKEAIRLFRVRKPVVAAVHGPAVGGGLGLAMVADFRVSCSEARFSANFCKLGFHPGFGLTTTLPRVVGNQMAALMFYTGRRIGGDEAKREAAAAASRPRCFDRTFGAVRDHLPTLQELIDTGAGHHATSNFRRARLTAARKAPSVVPRAVATSA